jgi:GNAT superfamily N-acetyltransferase
MPEATGLPDVHFRRFRGESDYPALLAVMKASETADQNERPESLADIARNYSQLTNCNPYRDMIFAEAGGAMAGYARGWWWDEPVTGRLFGIVAFLAPDWRRKGIGRSMLRWTESRLRELAAEHSMEPPGHFQVNVDHYQAGKAILLEREGYQPVRYFYEMVRPNLEDLPDWPLPDGLEIRTVEPPHYPAIWASVDEASQDEWGCQANTEEAYRAWIAGPHFQPDLWQIAWDPSTDQVAGHVLTFIDADENRELGRLRGYTEGVGVGRAWRRRGLARALIAGSLRAQRARGMIESALAADSDPSAGAASLYESCGFRVIRKDAIYRKAL